MDRTDIELFLSIVEHNSISKAAEILHFSQSTVSYRLKCLEKELNISLFYRRKGQRTSALTKQGELFIPIAKQWQELYKNTEEIQHYPNQLLDVAAISSVSASVLGDVYETVTSDAIKMCLHIQTAYSNVIYNLVEKNKVDIGFVAEAENRRNVLTIPVFSEKYYVVRKTRYPKAMGTVYLEDLQPDKEIFMDWNKEYENWHKEKWGNIASYHVWVDHFPLLQRFLRDEQFWAIIPGSLLPRIYENMQTVQVDNLEGDIPTDRTIYMIKNINPRENRLSTIVNFEKTLKDCLIRIPDVNVLL